MKINKLFCGIFCFVLFLLAPTFNVLYAQFSLNSGGTSATHQTGMVSYSIGQIFYKVSDNAFGAVHQGVHHIYKIELTQTSPDNKKADIDVFFAYPNPTSDFLTLRFTGDILKDYAFVLYDVLGRTITRQVLKDKETLIDLSGLSSGLFFLRITQRNSEVKLFKIVKSQKK